jgi:hypothetical protein
MGWVSCVVGRHQYRGRGFGARIEPREGVLKAIERGGSACWVEPMWREAEPYNGMSILDLPEVANSSKFMNRSAPYDRPIHGPFTACHCVSRCNTSSHTQGAFQRRTRPAAFVDAKEYARPPSVWRWRDAFLGLTHGLAFDVAG